ncbi:uncharacterized protein BP5553_05131 [Venustampulla echinocandica]|uniref:Uncharacterized protein n=1 Tax=Venustampulla echinocandica TaxID=2656787 RepID=A0A370TQB4_9HELO|nr:uncharacterized protein BP5553_05131 [Venustampulla echinocandica]RDL37698.1 hypothetical protein BP5553_05131 [Venustampulla echinocandica]
MKTTTFALGFMMSYTCGTAFALPSDLPNTSVSTSPFHDCVSSGKGFNECRAQSRGFKRDAPTSTSPFHDCMDKPDATLAKCTTSAGLVPRSADFRSKAEADGDLETRDLVLTERKLDINFKGFIDDLGHKLGGSEQCYSVNNLGRTSWLTNTAVSALKGEACTFAVNQALAATGNGIGKYTDTKSGFYMGNFGPVVSPKVKFFMTVLLTGADLAGIKDVKEFAIDLCTKGVDRLTGDPGCVSERKVGKKVSHMSVNGGEFDWALVTGDKPNNKPEYDNAGVCTNCIMTLVMEAANKVNKDGKTPVPIDQ